MKIIEPGNERLQDKYHLNSMTSKSDAEQMSELVKETTKFTEPQLSQPDPDSARARHWRRSRKLPGLKI
jgi:hypothetical protein